MTMDPDCPTVVAKYGVPRDWQDLSKPARDPAAATFWERAHCFECEQCLRYSRACALVWRRLQPLE